jgi:phosphate-selective porin OprO/OprP
VSFQGGYLIASYLLTGEHRPYKRVGGCFDRIVPLRPLYREPESCWQVAGTGAWEVAGRISFLDLDDENVRGGELTDVTLGLNWYATAYLRVTCNWVHAFLDRTGRSETDLFGMRVGYDF